MVSFKDSDAACMNSRLKSGLNNSIGPIARNCPKCPSGNSIRIWSCPPNLYSWTFGQPIFFLCQLQLTARPWRSLNLIVLQNYFRIGQLWYVSILSMISDPLCSINCILGSYQYCTDPVQYWWRWAISQVVIKGDITTLCYHQSCGNRKTATLWNLQCTCNEYATVFYEVMQWEGVFNCTRFVESLLWWYWRK